MRKHYLLVGILALSIPFLLSTPRAEAQSFDFSGLGFSGGLAPGSYQSMGTVPAMLGQMNNIRFGRFPPFFGARGHEFPFFDGDTDDFAFWFPGFFRWYYSVPYMGPYWYGNGPYYEEGAVQGYGSEAAPPPYHNYLEYSVKKKSLQQEAESGKALAVHFESDPSGAMIRVDGYFVGRTPATAQIPPGKHLVTVRKWGYEWWEQELNVEGDKPLHVNARLHLFGTRGRESPLSGAGVTGLEAR